METRTRSSISRRRRRRQRGGVCCRWLPAGSPKLQGDAKLVEFCAVVIRKLANVLSAGDVRSAEFIQPDMCVYILLSAGRKVIYGCELQLRCVLHHIVRVPYHMIPGGGWWYVRHKHTDGFAQEWLVPSR